MTEINNKPEIKITQPVAKNIQPEVKSEKTKTNIEEKGIKIKNKITYYEDDIKTNIIINKEELIIKRENNEFLNLIKLNIEKETDIIYYLKDQDLSINLPIRTKYIKLEDNIIEVKYKMLDSNSEYIYRIEIKELYRNK